MNKEEYYLRGKIVAICEAALAEEIGIIAASRRLSALGLELFERRHEDFITFDAVDTETDHLPVDKERKNWDAEALKRKDAEIAEAEAIYKNNVITACRKLIEQFAIYNKFET
ncbi:MAG TPA: DUF2489 domain-containing protein [Pyrinomonadaceae bacterium]|nr:DUF2489 domain-containing protein [Pyrinomonadaceae bacterium]